MNTYGLALGGGGARGLAHVVALQTIDACKIQPSAISGTSIGAIIGALYASGRSGNQIREGVEKHIVTSEDRIKDIFRKTPNLLKWLTVVRTDVRHGGFLIADKFMNYLLDDLGVTTFEELEIPFHVVATDFWSGKEVVFSSGELLPAIMASMAIPGIFSPVVIDDRVLVDGGIVNNVPFDLLMEQCTCTIAIDVAPRRSPDETRIPGIVDSTLGVFDMLVEKVMETKKQQSLPSIYIHPEISDVRILDFDKIESVFEQSEKSMQVLKEQLKQHIAEDGI